MRGGPSPGSSATERAEKTVRGESDSVLPCRFFTLQVGPRSSLFRRMPLRCAVLADALQRIVGRIDGESVRNLYKRDVYCFETECFMAYCAIEMDMHVIQSAFFFTFAYLVFDGPAAVIDGMDDMVLDEQFQGPEYAGLVYGIKYDFQIGKRNGPFG